MGLLNWLSAPGAPDAATRVLIERAIAAVDPLLKTVGSYERKLAPAVYHAIDYCESLAARIPGPFEISRAAFAADPLVHALFASADDIGTMLARSQCVREHLVGPAAPMAGQCCALLGMRHREKSGFGARLTGQLVCADQPQRTLHFEDHTLAEPAPDLERARSGLREAMFDGLIRSFAVHVAEVREERAGLRQEQALASARERVAGRAESQSRRYADLQRRLRATADALSPPRLLDALTDCLMSPEPYLRLEPVTFAVDRAGIIAGAGQGDADTLHFVELNSRDQRRWVVMLVRIEREEARRAVEGQEAARRHIVI